MAKQKGTWVTYNGASSRDDASGTFVIDGVVLRKGMPVEVKDEDLLGELRDGSDRTKGHKFEVGDGPDDDEQASKAAKDVAANDPGGAGGTGGAGPAPSTP